MRRNGIHHHIARRQLKEQMRQSEQLVKAALLASPAVVYNQDLDLRFTWIHGPTGLRQDYVIGKTDYDLLPEHEADRLTEIKLAVIRSGVGSRQKVQATYASFTFFYDLVVEPVKNTSGLVVGITCAAWDMTEQHHVEMQQRFLSELGVILSSTLNCQETLRSIAAASVHEIADLCVVDQVIESGGMERLTVVHTDPEMAEACRRLETFNLDRSASYLGSSVFESRQPLLVSAVSEEYIESISQSPEHLALFQKFSIQSIMVVPMIAHGRFLGNLILISCQDSRRYSPADLAFSIEVAQRAALAVENARLYEAANSAIRARDEILAVVAHDLRSPLSAAYLAADLLVNPPPGEDPGNSAREMGRAVARNLERANRLINDLLEVSQIEAGRVAISPARSSPLDLVLAAFEAHKAVASASDIDIRIDTKSDLPDVLADEDRIHQVFENLIGNAIKFTPAGGHIAMGATAAGNEVIFFIADTGKGIPETALSHVFDRFWKSDANDRRGAGLGLAIAQGLVEAHGGRIWAESMPGNGSKFLFTIPTVLAGALSQEPAA